MCKTAKRRLQGLMCAALCVCALFCDAMNGRADEITSDSIKQKEGQISEAKSEKDALQANLTDIKKLKQSLEAQKNDLAKYVAELDANLTSMQLKIDDLNRKITEKVEEIENEERELTEAQLTEKEQYEAMKKRIRFMYERGDTLYTELLFSSKGFSDLVNKAEYIEELSAYDRRMLDHYVEVTEYVQLCKEALEAEYDVLREALDDVKAEEEAVASLLEEKERQISVYQNDINTKQAAIKEYEAQIAEQNQIIAALEAAVAEERRQLIAAQGNALQYNGGKFQWPAPSYTRISEEYGNRIHPILGTPQFHNGIDLAAPGGSPILAAYDGKVVAAAYSGSMGNYIMINHGDGLLTIYMHASALYVSTGDTVVKGQKIAAVGSTGRSTGNHLHFSVRLNGNYVSPWNYLK